MTSNSTSYLEGVWGFSSTDVFAVGTGDTVLRYNGSGWSHMLGAQGPDLYDVWGSDNTDVFVVGAGGLILHWDGTAWGTMITPTVQGLLGVWGRAHSDVYAVGGMGTILHYDGTWGTVSTGTTSSFYDVWGSPTDLFVVGDGGGGGGGTGIICHYNGSTWDNVTTGTGRLYGVWGTSSTDVYAVGDPGTILHYDGSTWTTVVNRPFDPFWDVWGSSSSDVFAVGEGGAIMHWDGSTWSTMANPYGSDHNFMGVWGSSSTDVFVVGSEGTILHSAGASYFQVPTVTGTGIATFSPGCFLMTNLTAVDPTPLHPPNNIVFPDGIFSFNITGVPVGGTVTLYIQLPSGIPANATYWKYDSANGWVSISYTKVGANVISIQLTDGLRPGDSDGSANGIITDPGGLGGPGGGGEGPVPVFPSIYVGIAAAAGAFVLAYFAGRRLIAQKRG